MPGKEHAAQRLVGAYEVMQIGAGVIARGRAVGLFVERAHILGMAGIADIDLAAAREGQTMTAGTRRHHAVEHVDAARHRFQNIVRRADAHQVTRLFGGQHRQGDIEHAQHDILRLTDGKAADGITLEIKLLQPFGRADTQIRLITALYDTEHGLAGLFAKGNAAALRPAQRHFHGALDFLALGRQRDALIELHLDVGIEQSLNFDRAFR